MEYDSAKLVIGSAFFAWIALELALGRFVFRQLSTKKDVILDVTGSLVVPILILPSVLWLSTSLAAVALPGQEGAWGD